MTIIDGYGESVGLPVLPKVRHPLLSPDHVVFTGTLQCPKTSEPILTARSDRGMRCAAIDLPLLQSCEIGIQSQAQRRLRNEVPR
jgi:hypothetical protein